MQELQSNLLGPNFNWRVWSQGIYLYPRQAVNVLRYNSWLSIYSRIILSAYLEAEGVWLYFLAQFGQVREFKCEEGNEDSFLDLEMRMEGVCCKIGRNKQGSISTFSLVTSKDQPYRFKWFLSKNLKYFSLRILSFSKSVYNWCCLFWQVFGSSKAIIFQILRSNSTGRRTWMNIFLSSSIYNNFGRSSYFF